MRESVLNRCVWLLPATNAIEPVGHVRQIFVAYSSRRKRFVSRQENVLHDALPLNVEVLLVIPFLLHKLPSRTTLSARIEQRALLSHDSRETRRVVAKTGGVAHQESFWILQQRLKSVRSLAAVLPRKNSAMRHYRFRKRFIHEVVAQIDPMTHPLIGDAAGEILVQAILKIQLWIKRPIGLVHQPSAPIGIWLTQLLNLGAAAPSRPVVIPNDFVLCDFAESAGTNELPCGNLVRLTAMLRSYLNDLLAGEHRVASGLDFP